MGNITTLDNETHSDEQQNFHENMVYVGSKQHKYLGQIQLWRSKEDQSIWMFSKTTQIDINDQVIQREHKNRQSLRHNNLLKYYGTTIKNQLPLQGAIKEYKVYYEYIPTTLTDYIQQHRQQNLIINESYLWKFINEMVSVSGYLESQNNFHSDLNSDSIFIERNGDFKILYHGAFPGLISAYSKQFSNNNHRLLSPQQMKELALNIVNPLDDPYKVDSYQFGLILVQIMTRQDVSKYNDYYKELIHYQDILNLLGSSAQFYSQQLLTLVANLLQYNEQQRPKLSALFQNRLCQQIPYKAQYIQPFVGFNIYQKNNQKPISQLSSQLPSKQVQPKSQLPMTITYQSPMKITNRIQTCQSASRYPLFSSGVKSAVFYTQESYMTPQKQIARRVSQVLSTRLPRTSQHAYQW